MIKLIATDMDGTFLDSKKRLPANFKKFSDALDRRGILFVPVSGRSYPHFQMRFPTLADSMSFICCNGGLIMHHGKVLSHEIFSEDQLREIFQALRAIPDLHLSLIGIHQAYYEHPDPEIIRQMKEFFEVLVRTDRLEDLIGTQPFGKVSSLDDRGVQENSFPAVSSFAERFNVTDAGDNWLDIMPLKANKANAIGTLCRELNIDVDNEVMIFGDYLNDYAMMTVNDNTWCMKNGHEKIKEISGHVTEWTNDENGVIRTICQEIDLDL